MAESRLSHSPYESAGKTLWSHRCGRIEHFGACEAPPRRAEYFCVVPFLANSCIILRPKHSQNSKGSTKGGLWGKILKGRLWYCLWNFASWKGLLETV